MGVLKVKRIDNYKVRLEKAFAENKNGKKLSMTFQELINLLTTYDDKRALSDLFEELKKKSKVSI